MPKALIIIICLTTIFCVLAMIYFGQHRMLYHPRGYAPKAKAFQVLHQVRYPSLGNSQTSYVFPKTAIDSTPERVWWLFGGNGSTALGWEPLFDQLDLADSGTAVVLVDYPGYGKCRGKPSPEAIYQSVDDLIATLAKQWNLPKEELMSRSSAIGHSLGAAIALHTTATHEMTAVTAIAPFTSMADMAKLKVGFLSFLLRHHYDNRSTIAQLSKHPSSPKITIYHGDADSLIPISMGRELTEIAGAERATFIPLPRRGHNDVVGAVIPDLVTAIEMK